MMNDCPCPDLTTAIPDLHTAIVALTDELRQARQAEQEGIEALVELHEQPKAVDAENQ